MKSQKLIVIAAIVCLLVGVSGAAVAQLDRNDCPDGSLTGGTYDEIVIDKFVSCNVVGVLVTGRVLVKNADEFTMINSLVQGSLRVIHTKSVTLVDNHVNGGSLVAKGNTFSTVVRNVLFGGGSMRVNDDECVQLQEVAVLQNLIRDGNLRVNCNEKADVKDNKVTNGSITCRGNDRLDSLGNVALEGTVNCRRNLFQ